MAGGQSSTAGAGTYLPYLGEGRPRQQLAGRRELWVAQRRVWQKTTGWAPSIRFRGIKRVRGRPSHVFLAGGRLRPLNAAGVRGPLGWAGSAWAGT